MSTPFSRKTMILIQAISILLFALVSAAIPNYAFIIFLLYFLVFMFLAMRATTRTMKIPPRNELGSPLFKELNALQVMLSDKMFQAEMNRQMKLMFVNLGLVFLLFILLPVYNSYIWPFISGALGLTGESILVNFTRFLGLYLFFIGVMQGMRYMLIRGQSSTPPVIPARVFAVYKKGVVLDERQFVKFTEDICFRVDHDRKFVELVNTKGNTVLTRLYTLEVGKLTEKLREAGVNECKQ
ncbi:MAG: DUF2208 domain-containing protein [Desulfurococcus sp.]|uniref:DUF2208 domain-containing protein n=1 Tax=Desulfurococcus sp. TaxID=51678 RepID=UPI0031639267